jgi:uncharacterized protein
MTEYDFYRNLKWMKGTTLKGEPFYFFPDSLTLIEFDEHFGRLLEDLKRHDDLPVPGNLQGYPEGYVDDVLFNMALLDEKGLLRDYRFPGVPRDVPVGRLVVANTMRCNLACRYCYNRFDFNAPARGEKDMSLETFGRLIRFFAKNGGDLPFHELFFIGGEPLLNIAILEEAAGWSERQKAEGKNLFIAATTNATLLDKDMVDFCSTRRIHLKLTIDGGREEHDANRVFPGGEGSFETIADNLDAFLASNAHQRAYVATTIDTRRTEPRERVAALSAMGFNAIDLVELYREGGDVQDDEELALIFGHRYRRLMEFLFLKVQAREYLHIIPLFDIVKHLHLRKPRFLRCRAGGDSLAVSAEGTIFPCHHFFGDERFALGSVFDDDIPSSRLAPYRIPVGERPGCAACWARLLCGGPCFHRSLALTGDAFRSATLECARTRALIMEAMRFYIKLRNEDPGALDWFVVEGTGRPGNC